MYYPEDVPCDIEIIPSNPYGLPPDPVFENNENQNDNSYFNAVIRQMYRTHKNTILFPAAINCSKSMEISNLHPIEPPKSHNKKNARRHKSDQTNETKLRKNHSRNSNKDKKNTKGSKENSHTTTSSRNGSDIN